VKRRCHICERPVEHDHDPHQPEGHYADDPCYVVAMGNGIYVDACWSCWFKWPDAHKLFPAVRSGRWPDESESAGDDEFVNFDDLALGAIGETA
jgi:hypothetical protein